MGETAQKQFFTQPLLANINFHVLTWSSELAKAGPDPPDMLHGTHIPLP